MNVTDGKSGLWGALAGLIVFALIAVPLSAAFSFATHPNTQQLFGGRLEAATEGGYVAFWWIVTLFLLALPFLVGYGVAKLSARSLVVIGGDRGAVRDRRHGARPALRVLIAPPIRGAGGVMQMAKASEESKARFRSVVPDAPGVEVKPMFGNLGAFVNGNMFAGLFGDQIGVKLVDEAVRAELAAIDGVGPFGPDERPMGGYLALPAAWADEPGQLAMWMSRAYDAVSQLPPKPPKAPKR